MNFEIDISSDGKTLVVGTRHNYFHVFSIESKELVKTVYLTDDTNGSSTIKDCFMVPGFCYENKLLIVLTQEGKPNWERLHLGLCLNEI